MTSVGSSDGRAADEQGGWAVAGLLLHASYPELFAIPSDFVADFSRCKVKRFSRDAIMRVWLPTLIIQGSAVVAGGTMTGEKGPAAPGKGQFQLVLREDCETLQFCQARGLPLLLRC